MGMTDALKPTRRRFQYSLRTLLEVVTLCALPCSWLAVKLLQAEQQREAVASIEKLGGVVFYSRPSGPPWLRSVLGNDFFDHVESVNLFSNPQITNADLKHLKRLNQLTWLGLQFNQVTDTGLENLKGLNQFQTLFLDGTQVTDEGVKKLQQALPNCKILH